MPMKHIIVAIAIAVSGPPPPVFTPTPVTEQLQEQIYMAENYEVLFGPDPQLQGLIGALQDSYLEVGYYGDNTYSRDYCAVQENDCWLMLYYTGNPEWLGGLEGYGEAVSDLDAVL